jgi:asparagine synthase (glutamine-hydrolysing)
VGIKPLYYAQLDGAIAFASRPKALRELPGVPRVLEREYLAVFAASHYRYIDNQPEKSPYRGIRQVPAGSAVYWRPGEDPRTEAYWRLEDRPLSEPDPEKLALRYRELLLDAVRIRLERADRPAFTLSGGLDSSSVLSCAVEISGGKQHAYSTVYSDDTYDESAEIADILPQKTRQWHPVEVPDQDILPFVERMVELHDEPVATATWLSHHLLARQVAADGFGSLFGGLGGDELNAGEYEYFIFHFADLRDQGRTELLEEEIALWARHHDHPIFKKSREAALEAMERMTAGGGRCLPDRGRLERYADALAPEFFDLRSYEPVTDHPFAEHLKNRTFQDIFRETAPCCLRAEDRQTMNLGLDHFLPFFDHRLVELMFSVPGTLKIRGGVTKQLLRRAMQGILPEPTRTRVAKTGWNAPAHIWFSGRGLDMVRDLVRSESFRGRGIYNLPRVEEILDDHRRVVEQGLLRENHMMFLWQLVNLELWLRSLGPGWSIG